MRDIVKGPFAIKLVCHNPTFEMTIFLYLTVTHDTSAFITIQSSNLKQENKNPNVCVTQKSAKSLLKLLID